MSYSPIMKLDLPSLSYSTEFYIVNDKGIYSLLTVGVSEIGEEFLTLYDLNTMESLSDYGLWLSRTGVESDYAESDIDNY